MLLFKKRHNVHMGSSDVDKITEGNFCLNSNTDLQQGYKEYSLFCRDVNGDVHNEDFKDICIFQIEYCGEQFLLQKKYKIYRISPYCTEVSKDFFAFAKDFICSAMQPYNAILNIIFDFELLPKTPRAQLKHKKKWANLTQSQMLANFKAKVPLDNYRAIEIMTTTSDFAYAMKLLEQEQEGGYFYKAYGYDSSLLAQDMFGLSTYADEYNYTVFFEYSKYPDQIMMIIDTEKIKITDIIEKLQQVCNANGKNLIIE